MSGFDGFGDVIERENGIFAGSQGLSSQDQVRHSPTPEGLLIECNCQRCGYPRHVTVPWPELVALKYNVSPHEAFASHPQLRQFAAEWQLPTQAAVNRGVKYAWFPAGLTCRCGEQFRRPHISPAECDALLAPARQNQFIRQDAEKAIAQHCFQVARHLGRR